MCQQGHAEANWPERRMPELPVENLIYTLQSKEGEVAALRAEVERLREALRGYVISHRMEHSDHPLTSGPDCPCSLCAAARAALQEKQDG